MKIGDNAFKDCDCLSQLVLPTFVKYIGENAFSGCTLLEGFISLQDNCNFLGKNAFKDCASL